VSLLLVSDLHSLLKTKLITVSKHQLNLVNTRHGHYRIEVEFTTTYAISAYHH
jgi:hypothetical protein